MSLKTKISISISAILKSVLDLVEVEAPLSLQYHNIMDDGTGSEQADKVFSDRRTLAASASEDLDLAGSLVDALGAVITFAKVKAIIIRAVTENTNNVIVGAASATQFVGPFGANTHTIAIPPAGLFVITAPKGGWTVGAGASDLLKIANSSSGTSVTYDIVIVGTSA